MRSISLLSKSHKIVFLECTWACSRQEFQQISLEKKMENIYHNLKGNTNPKTISNINRWNRPQLRGWKAFWPNSTFHPFTYIILDLSLSLYRQVPLNFSLSNSNTQINHWRTFISMHWHFFSLSLVTIWTLFFKFRTDSREHRSIHITSVQLYKIRCTRKRR